MNRLINALAFAAIVIALFVSNSHLPQKLASSRLAGQLVQHFRGNDLPVLASLDGLPPVPPRIELERAVSQAQRAQVILQRVEMRRAMARARVKVERASGACKVVRLDQ